LFFFNTLIVKKFSLITKSSNNNSPKTVKRKDKTLIIGERFYNLFFVTHIDIINFDQNHNFSRNFNKLQNVPLQIKEIIMTFR